MSSKLIDFYFGNGTDFAGRRIEDIWAMSFEELEYNHDFIQWLFPLRERSGAQPDAPVLDDATIHAFQARDLRERLVTSAEVMARFYGLEIVDGDVRRSPTFDERRTHWMTRGNHNFLRLTRIMTSLATLGHDDLARSWQQALIAIYDQHSSVIGPTTLGYWRDAVRT